jgi:hypothetical protein
VLSAKGGFVVKPTYAFQQAKKRIVYNHMHIAKNFKLGTTDLK